MSPGSKNHKIIFICVLNSMTTHKASLSENNKAFMIRGGFLKGISNKARRMPINVEIFSPEIVLDQEFGDQIHSFSGVNTWMWRFRTFVSRHFYIRFYYLFHKTKSSFYILSLKRWEFIREKKNSASKIEEKRVLLIICIAFVILTRS